MNIANLRYKLAFYTFSEQISSLGETIKTPCFLCEAWCELLALSGSELDLNAINSQVTRFKIITRANRMLHSGLIARYGVGENARYFDIKSVIDESGKNKCFVLVADELARRELLNDSVNERDFWGVDNASS